MFSIFQLLRPLRKNMLTYSYSQQQQVMVVLADNLHTTLTTMIPQ